MSLLNIWLLTAIALLARSVYLYCSNLDAVWDAASESVRKGLDNSNALDIPVTWHMVLGALLLGQVLEMILGPVQVAIIVTSSIGGFFAELYEALTEEEI